MTTVGYMTLHSTNDSMDLQDIHCDTEGWLCSECDGHIFLIENTTTEVESMPLYCRYLKFKKVSKIIYVLVALFIFLLAIIGNSLVLVIVKKFRDMKNVTNYLLANLAVTDLTSTFLASLPSTIIYFQDLNPEQWTLVVINYVQAVATQASCITFIVLAVHRYFVSRNMFAKGNQVPYRIQLSSVPKIIASIWILSAVLHGPVLIFKIRQGIDDEKWRYYMIYYFIMVYVNPLVIIPVLYYNIVDLIWRATSVRSNGSNSSAVLSGIRLQTHRKKKRASRVIFAVVCVFIVCWTPFSVFNFYIAFFPDRSPISMWPIIDSAKLVSHILIYFSNCINPFIYAFSGLPYRRHFKELFALCVIYCAKPETQMDTTNDFIYS